MDISQVEVDARARDDLGPMQGLLELFGAILFEVPEEELNLEAPIEELGCVWLPLKSPRLSQKTLPNRIYPRREVPCLFGEGSVENEMSSFPWVLSPRLPLELFGEERRIFLSLEYPRSIDVTTPTSEILVVSDLGGQFGWNDQLSDFRYDCSMVLRL